MSNASNFDTTVVLQGWSSASNVRGTFQIISECLATLILCSWSCICCNIPAPDDSAVLRLLRKCWLMFISMLGPEYLLYISLGQWISAKKSVSEFQRLGYDRWTIKHGFYADMGGFRLQIADESDWLSLNTKSLIWLIEEGFISREAVDKEITLDLSFIDDRNKADAVVRVIALGQTLWFMVNVLARIGMGYPVSTLEITVLGYLVPVFVTYWLWWYKPRDVYTANTISIGANMAEIQKRGSCHDLPKHSNPLDSIGRSEHHGSLLYEYWLNIIRALLRYASRPFTKSHHHQRLRPSQYRSDNKILEMKDPFRNGWFEVLPTVWYLGTSYLAWNWHFPTLAEQWLWRGACIGMTVTYGFGAGYEGFLILTWSKPQERDTLARKRAQVLTIREKLADADHTKGFPRGDVWILRFRLLLHRLRNNSVDDDPCLDVPLRLLIPATIAVLVYLLCRLYMLVEDVIGLRQMPAEVYKTVPWTQSLPHLA